MLPGSMVEWTPSKAGPVPLCSVLRDFGKDVLEDVVLLWFTREAVAAAGCILGGYKGACVAGATQPL